MDGGTEDWCSSEQGYKPWWINMKQNRDVDGSFLMKLNRKETKKCTQLGESTSKFRWSWNSSRIWKSECSTLEWSTCWPYQNRFLAIQMINRGSARGEEQGCMKKCTIFILMKNEEWNTPQQKRIENLTPHQKKTHWGDTKKKGSHKGNPHPHMLFEYSFDTPQDRFSPISIGEHKHKDNDGWKMKQTTWIWTKDLNGRKTYKV